MAGGYPVLILEKEKGLEGSVRAENSYRVSHGANLILGVHGFGIVRGRAVSQCEDLRQVLKTDETEADFRDLGNSIKGSLTLYLADRESNYYILPDPWGGGLVFYWEDARYVVASSSLPDLITQLAMLGIRPKKSVGWLATLGVTGNGGIYDSPFEGVRVLDQFLFIRMSKTKGLEILSYESAQRTFSIDRSQARYAEALAEYTTEVAENIAALSEYPATHYLCHLTGGLDSRTVFSALSSTPYLKKYSIYTSGSDNTVDVKIARQVAAEAGVPFTRFSGLVPKLATRNAQENANWAMEETGGVISGPANIGLMENKSTIVLSGGYGEILRGFYGDFEPNQSAEAKIRWLTDALLGIGAPSYSPFKNRGGLFKNSVIEQTRMRATGILKKHEELGLPADTLPEFAYFSLRNRFYVGEITRSISQYALRADPLYAHSLFRLAFTKKRSERMNCFVQLDVARRFNQRLAALPYDKDRIGQDYVQYTVGSFSPQEFSTGTQPHEVVITYPPARLVGNAAAIRISDQDRKRAEELRIPPRFVANEARNKSRITGLITGEYGSLIETIFNIDVLQAMLKSNRNNRPQLRTLELLANTFSWLES